MNKKKKQVVKMGNGSVIHFDDNDSEDPIFGFNSKFYDPDDYQEIGQLIGQRDEEE